MAERDPRFGDWKFQFVADSNGGGMAMYWITLGQYKNRKRHILIDAVTFEPLEVTGDGDGNRASAPRPQRRPPNRPATAPRRAKERA